MVVLKNTGELLGPARRPPLGARSLVLHRPDPATGTDTGTVNSHTHTSIDSKQPGPAMPLIQRC